MNSELLCELKDGVAILTINRPQRRNSLSPEVIQQLGRHLDELEPDPSARVVCLTGAGDKAFCSGADLGGALKTGEEGQAGGQPQGPALYAGLLARMCAFEKPLVARVAGPCLAGGLGLMLSCDIVIARDDAFFSTPEVDVGLFPYMVGALLQRNVQWKKAMDMVLSGRRIQAAEAERMGLVSRVESPERFDEAVSRTLASLADKSPLGMRLGKRAFSRMREMSLAPALEMLSRALCEAAATEDAREGMRAFAEKRKPVFHGR